MVRTVADMAIGEWRCPRRQHLQYAAYVRILASTYRPPLRATTVDARKNDESIECGVNGSPSGYVVFVEERIFPVTGLEQQQIKC